MKRKGKDFSFVGTTHCNISWLKTWMRQHIVWKITILTTGAQTVFNQRCSYEVGHDMLLSNLKSLTVACHVLEWYFGRGYKWMLHNLFCCLRNLEQFHLESLLQKAFNKMLELHITILFFTKFGTTYKRNLILSSAT